MNPRRGGHRADRPAQPRHRDGYLRPWRRRGSRPVPSPAALQQPGPRLRGLPRRRPGAMRGAAAQHRDRHRLQRHGLGAPPLREYPALLKKAVAAAGGVAQVAGGVPAMCDGVTQGEPGMDLCLISRDVIAMATVIGLSHDIFDGALLLGVCDKIVPGLLMGALQFGHLPMVLVPAGPDALGAAQQRQGPGPRAVRRGRDRPRGDARGRVPLLPQRRHLHLLRHRQLQPADRDAGPAPARRRPSSTPTTRCARR